VNIAPISLRDANEYVRRVHRHHGPTRGHKFSVSLVEGEEIRGVAIVGRPVSRHLDDGVTLEVTRLATDGSRNACSMLYAACRRAAFAMGYRSVITYTLGNECGTSLRASGWCCEGPAGGGSWNGRTRHRVDKAPTCLKVRWRANV
jgi:hypothetical protein